MSAVVCDPEADIKKADVRADRTHVEKSLTTSGDLFRTGQHETERQAWTRRITGLASALPAGVAYYLTIQGGKADIAATDVVAACAGVVLALVTGLVLESRGRGWVAVVVAIALGGLLALGLSIPNAGPTETGVVVAIAYLVGAAIVAVHDFSKYRRPSRSTRAATWTVGAGEVVTLVECNSCGKAVCAQPTSADKTVSTETRATAPVLSSPAGDPVTPAPSGTAAVASTRPSSVQAGGKRTRTLGLVVVGGTLLLVGAGVQLRRR
ncbi:hypothetical protein [Modestobacter sp. SYSU DS0657]